ncbi:MAG TPA: FAD-dependent monooxygenase [Allosphingosinicella sp.]|jgi:flavin-dependent dehydrogenase
MRRTAALIVGGGPAGCAAAIALARAGAAPELLERSSGPRDVVCGGFLGWDALAALSGLGVDPWALGARPIGRLRLIGAGRTVEARLPYRAAGLSRRRLDQALIAAAADAGALVERGAAVRAVAGARRVRLDCGEERECEALFLATGKHELRGLARPRGRAEPAVGFRTALPASADLARALEGVIELHLFDGGYAGLLLQEDGSANLCISASAERLRKAGGIQQLIAQLALELPSLQPRLGGASRPGSWEAIAGVPYGWRARGTEAGVFRLGDQAAVIPSLAGDGIAIALVSGSHAAAAFLEQGPLGAASYQSGFSARAARPLGIASTLRHAAENRALRSVLMPLFGFAPSLVPLAARLTRIS